MAAAIAALAALAALAASAASAAWQQWQQRQQWQHWQHWQQHSSCPFNFEMIGTSIQNLVFLSKALENDFGISEREGGGEWREREKREEEREREGDLNAGSLKNSKACFRARLVSQCFSASN